MNPLRLILQAYGPYAQREVIDFRLLGDHRLFNIGGPTGSGKTSIMDGFCYGLLDQASGKERTSGNMRSDFAAPDLRTEVILDFQIGAKFYRVQRSPEQPRPKKRGEGFTKEGPQATLWDRTGLLDDDEEGNVLATGASKVTVQVKQLIGGLSLDQLRQICILAQGEFRQVITANSDERTIILGKLFETSRYARVERILKNEKMNLHRELALSREREQALLDAADVETVAELETAVHDLDQVVQENEKKAQALQKTADEARKALEKGKADQARLDEVAEATKHHATLIAQKPAIDVKQIELKRAEAARALRDVDTLREQRIREQKTAEKMHQDAKLLATRAVEAAEAAEKRLTAEKARDPERLQAQQKLDHYAGLAQKVQALAEAQAAVAAATAKAELTVKAQAAADEGLVKLREQHATAEALLAQAKLEAAGLENTKKALEAARQRVANRKELDAKRAALAATREQKAEAEKNLLAALQSLEAARAAFDSLQTARMMGHAALLAEALEEGSACPVCGSEEHPDLAEAHGEMPSENDLETALQGQRAAEKARETCQTIVTEIAVKIAGFEAAIETLVHQLKEAADAPLADLLAQEESLEQAHAKAQEAAQSLLALQQTLDKLALSVTKAETTLVEANQLLATAQQELKAAQAILQEREGEVPQEIRAAGALDAALKAAEEHLKALQAALVEAEKAARASAEKLSECKARVETLAKALETALQRAKEAETEFVKRVAEAKFKDVADYEGARRDDPAMAALSRIVEQFKEALAKAMDRLERARKAAEALKTPELGSLEEAFQKASAALAEQIEELGKLRNALQVQKNHLAELQRIAKEQGARNQRFKLVGRLADVSWGSNGAGLTFERYVLAAMLDDVLLQTNLRFQKMTSGRYTLHRDEDVRTRKGRHGLDLNVRDAYTGKSRPAFTLSGGEGFQASLSLALGLADTVQAQAGGIHLDTIFVDEGFGSLGQEDLDSVMGALEDLQEGGRLVGVISHVPELAERIPARLEVEKGTEGSHARFILP